MLGVMVEALIQATGVRVSYGQHEAVRGIDLTVYDGEIVAVLGTNGAGKTTLLECLEGLRAPTSGDIRLLGYDPFAHRAETRPAMGIMLQEGGFAGDLTVRETAQLWRAVNTRAGDVDAALEEMGLDHRAAVPVKQLSGGEKRRLDVVLAALKRPRILFLDEPTTGLDPESRADAWAVIGSLRAAGATIVLTTHYLEEAERLADRIIILHEGVIAATGTVAEVVARERASIRFRCPTSAILPPLRGEVRRAAVSPNQSVVEECPAGQDTVVVRTDAPQQDLLSVLLWAEEHGIDLADLRATPATLEDIFAAVVNSARSRAEAEAEAEAEAS
jgi:ABC-2 type transport system ATP-binding protein